MKNIASAIVAALAVQAGGVYAEDETFYVGGKLGIYDIDQSFLQFNDFAGGVYAGYRFNKYVAVEIEYIHLAEDSDEGLDFDGDLYVGSVRPTLPLNDNWEVFAKLGWGHFDATVNSYYGKGSGTDDDFVWGVGTAWSGDGFHVRGEVQADSDVPDFMIYTVGIGIDF